MPETPGPEPGEVVPGTAGDGAPGLDGEFPGVSPGDGSGVTPGAGWVPGLGTGGLGVAGVARGGGAIGAGVTGGLAGGASAKLIPAPAQVRASAAAREKHKVFMGPSSFHFRTVSNLVFSHFRGRINTAGWLLLAASLLSGCGHPVQETAAHKIADALPSVLGPAAHYDVQVNGDPFALSRGRAKAVHIQGQEVQIAPSITLDTLDADAHDVSFSRETRRLDHIGETDFTATMSQEHLASYLARTKPRLPGLVVTLGDSDVQAQVPVTFLGLRTTVSLTGALSPDADAPGTLDFVTDSAHLSIVPLPASLVNLALNLLNPLIDLSQLRVPLTVAHVRVVHTRLTLDGTADLNGLVRSK